MLGSARAANRCRWLPDSLRPPSSRSTGLLSPPRRRLIRSENCRRRLRTCVAHQASSVYKLGQDQRRSCQSAAPGFMAYCGSEGDGHGLQGSAGFYRHAGKARELLRVKGAGEPRSGDHRMGRPLGEEQRPRAVVRKREVSRRRCHQRLLSTQRRDLALETESGSIAAPPPARHPMLAGHDERHQSTFSHARSAPSASHSAGDVNPRRSRS